ncbi:MAG: regulatory iron-sulfur-containing complex subunit RicT [Bacteroidota bacterium]
MGCNGCSTGKNGKPNGCKSNGSCGTGGCNRLNTYDWLAVMDIHEPEQFDVVEVSFKNGSRKSFYKNPDHTRAITGDMVVVEAAAGYDVGQITLSGELVRLQMRKKRFKEDNIAHKILRRANERDLEKLQEARQLERQTMVRSRVISRQLGLDMKVGDVEYQGDKRKATFYYTADGRVDFRELIRHYAKEFRVKIEMRQIGARQESARIGGLGSCGRELCCSTWLTDFKSVSTAAARYQNLAINQSKLSGQCGRLKCCLNYELDTYAEAVEDFPKNADKLKTTVGFANLIKTNIFKREMFYIYDKKDGKGGKVYNLSVERVKEIQAMNRAGEFPMDLVDLESLSADLTEKAMDFEEDLTGVIELPPEKRKKRRRGKRNNSNKGRNAPKTGGNKRTEAKEQGQKENAKPQRKGGPKRSVSRKPSGSKKVISAKSPPAKSTGPKTPEAKVDGQSGDAKKSSNKRRRPNRSKRRRPKKDGSNNQKDTNSNNNNNDKS